MIDWFTGIWEACWLWFTSIDDWSIWGTIGGSLAWIVTLCLLLAGLIGCFVPVVPGHLLVLLAAIVHHLMLGEDAGVEWWTYVVLGTCLIISQALEFMSGAAGSKWFGGTRWGSVGALVGGVIGMFFFPWGLIVGPLAGAFGAEWLFAKRSLEESAKSGAGSVFGTLSGLAIKAVIGFVMIGWFVIDVFFVG